MEKMLTELLGLGCAPVDSGAVDLKQADCDRCAPEDFYSTTNQRTLIRHNGQWLEVEGAGGASPADAPRAFRSQEAKFANGWFNTITSEIFG